MDAQGTSVMTLGRTPHRFGAAQISPEFRYNPMPGHRTASPSQPQNLPRPTLQNGPHAFAGHVVQLAALGNLGQVMGMLGRHEEEPNGSAPQVAPQPDPGQPTGDAYVPSGNEPGFGGDPYTPLVQQGWLTPGQADAWRNFDAIMVFVRPISSAASAYHGYKRTGSYGWAFGWMILGGLFPLVTPAIGLAQGWGKPKKR